MMHPFHSKYVSFFRVMAYAYSSKHGVMAKPHKSCDMTENATFAEQGGITNGAEWYSVAGGESFELSLHHIY